MESQKNPIHSHRCATCGEPFSCLCDSVGGEKARVNCSRCVSEKKVPAYMNQKAA